MLLAIDVGNTNVHLAISDDANAEWVLSIKFATIPSRTSDEWYSLLVPHLKKFAISRCALCSVVPRVTDSLTRYTYDYLHCDALEINSELDLGIQVNTAVPDQTGADRIVNAAAAFQQFNGAIVIVDIGTATKVDAVDGSGALIGGAIAPGLAMGIDSLASRAARLYAVPMAVPESTIGRDTLDAVQSGVVLGHIAMVEGLVGRVSEELREPATIALTGGAADTLRRQFRFEHHYLPNLTLDGIRLIDSRNR